MTSLTAAVVPSLVGSGQYLRLSTDALCPPEVLDINAALTAFDFTSSDSFGIGVSTIGGQAYILVYVLFTDDPGDPAVYYIEYPSLTVVGRSLVPSNDYGDGMLLFGPPVFDAAGDMWTVWYNPSDNHDWLTHSACPGIGSDYGTTPDDLLVDFGVEGATSLFVAPIGFNPYDGWVYYSPKFKPSADLDPAEIRRYRIGDGDEAFTSDLYARSAMLVFTPDGALWSMKREFTPLLRELMVYRVETDGSFAATTDIETPNTNNSASQSPFPLTDNSVLISGRAPTHQTWQVASDLSFATSACSLGHFAPPANQGTALVATGLLLGGFLAQVHIYD